MGFGRVRVLAAWIRVPIRVLARFESQLHGFKSQSGFWPGSSPSHMGSSPNLRCTFSVPHKQRSEQESHCLLLNSVSQTIAWAEPSFIQNSLPLCLRFGVCQLQALETCMDFIVFSKIKRPNSLRAITKTCLRVSHLRKRNGQHTCSNKMCASFLYFIIL